MSEDPNHLEEIRHIRAEVGLNQKSVDQDQLFKVITIGDAGKLA